MPHFCALEKPHFREITFVKAHIKQANVLKQKGVCGNQELRL